MVNASQPTGAIWPLKSKTQLSLQGASQSEHINNRKIASGHVLAVPLAAAERRKKDLINEIATCITHDHFIRHFLASVKRGCQHGQSQRIFDKKMGNSNAI